MKPPQKYSLSPDVILRSEPQYYGSYSAFNYKTVTSQALNEAEMKALRYIQTRAAVVDEIAEASGLKNKECKKLLEEMHKQWIVRVNERSPAATAPQVQVNSQAYSRFPIPFLSAPAQVDLFITNRCNLNCAHCFAEVKGGQATDYPLEELGAAFRMLERMGVLEVRISGGEPLLHGEILQVLDLMGHSRLRRVLLTNGTMLTDEIVLALKAAGITPTVSLDDYDPETHDQFRGVKGAQERTIEGLQLLQKHSIEYGINCCLNKKNLNRIQNIIDLAVEYGAARIAFLDLKPIGRMRNNPEWMPTKAEYEAALKRLFVARARNRKTEVSVDAFLHCYPMQESMALAKKGVVSCRAGISRLSISSDGTVYPCNFVLGDHHWAMGNLKQQALEKIWFSQKWLFFRGQTRLGDLKTCGDCKNRKGCVDFYCRLLPYGAGDAYGAPEKCKR